jgi:methionyl-tRNA formyltransferase
MNPDSQYNAVVFAYHDVGVRCLSVLLARGVDVALVVTHRDDPKENIWFASVERLAREHELDVAIADDPNAPEFVSRLSRLAPDFLFSFYYRHMLSPAVLATATRGAFNMHGSLLPKYRGRVPVNWAVLRGESETGATLHEMVEKPDAGRIVDQLAVPILPDDLAVEVFRKVTVAAEMVLHRSLPDLIDGTARFRPQDLAGGSYFGARKPDDGRIDWSQGAHAIHDLVRAVAPPYPGAFTTLGNARLRVLRTRVLARATRPAAPTLAVDAEGHVTIDCADGGRLRVLECDSEGIAMDGVRFRERFGPGPHRLGVTP